LINYRMIVKDFTAGRQSMLEEIARYADRAGGAADYICKETIKELLDRPGGLTMFEYGKMTSCLEYLHCRGYVLQLPARASRHWADEALNSGDGTYKP